MIVTRILVREVGNKRPLRELRIAQDDAGSGWAAGQLSTIRKFYSQIPSHNITVAAMAQKDGVSGLGRDLAS